MPGLSRSDHPSADEARLTRYGIRSVRVNCLTTRTDLLSRHGSNPLRCDHQAHDHHLVSADLTSPAGRSRFRCPAGGGTYRWCRLDCCSDAALPVAFARFGDPASVRPERSAETAEWLELRRRHPPPRHCSCRPSAVLRTDQRGIVREDAGQRRQIARFVVHDSGNGDDRRLDFRHAVKVAHAARLARGTVPANLNPSMAATACSHPR